MQRVAAGHQAALEALQTTHPEVNLLRGQIETRSLIRLVKPKSLMQDRFWKKTGPSWRTWSYLARDFVGVVHTALEQAMKNVENQKQPISVTDLQHDYGVTKEMDQELQHVLISRTEGEALEVVRGAEREPGLEQWRRLAALCDPLAAGRSLDDNRQILYPPRKLLKWMTSRKQFKPTKTSNKDTGSALETSYPKTCDLLFSSPSVLQILRERELTAQQHLLPDYAQMRAHIVTVINSRTRGPPPMMMGNWNEEASNHDSSSDELVEGEDGELYRLEVNQRWRERQNRQRMFSLWAHWPHQSPP